MKKVLIVLLLVIIALGGAIYYFAGSINSIVEQQIEKHGTNSLQTNVEVGAVNIKLMDGLGEISDFSIANPQGFSANNALGFKKVKLDIDTQNITEMPIVIEEILIDSVSTRYELNAAGKGNLNALLEQASAGAHSDKSTSSDTSPTDTPSENTPNESASDIRIVVQKLTIKDTQLALDLTAIGQKAYDETLPSFSIKNIGGKEGLPPEQLAAAMGKSLLKKIIKEAKEKQSEKLKNKAKDKIMEKVNEKGSEKLKGLMNKFSQ